MSRACVLLPLPFLLAVSGCGGGGGPSAPTTVAATPRPPSIPAGAALSLVSGEAGQPVVGATVVINGQSPSGPFTSTFTSDPSGRVILDRDVLLSPPPLLDVVASGFLSRNTLLRNESERVFSLWPTEGLMSQSYLSSLVYTQSTCPAEENPTLSLRRIAASAGRATVVFDSSLQGDSRVRETHEEAVARLNVISQRVGYAVSDERPSGGVVFTAKLDPSASLCTDGGRTIAFATNMISTAGEIVSGTVTYCALDVARSISTVAHELGHTSGFRHSGNRSDVMYCNTGRLTTTYSDREALVLSLMFLRRPGTLWPDNDRDTTASLRRAGVELYVCS